MIRPVNPDSGKFLKWKTSAACKKGQIAVMNSDLALPAAAGASAATVLGVFAEDADSGAIASIYNAHQIFEADFYQGSSTDTATDAMLGVGYDIYVDGAAGDGSAEGETYLDLNDTIGDFCVLLDYDNNRRVGQFRFTDASILI
jgi:hypothetical protein